MRLRILITVCAVIALTPVSAYAADAVNDGAGTVYETEYFKFAIPEGWAGSEIGDEAYKSLMSFDDNLARPPLGLVADDESAGMMILMSERKDGTNTFFDYMLLRQWSELEIYNLFDGQWEFADMSGKKRECSLMINAIDDGKSSVLISHNLILFAGDFRFEFAYFADADKYGPNYKALEAVLSSLEFM